MRSAPDRHRDYHDPPPPEDDALYVHGYPSAEQPPEAHRRRPHPPRRIRRPAPVPDLLRLRVSGWSSSSVPQQKPLEGDATRKVAPAREWNRIPLTHGDSGAGACPRCARECSPPDPRPPLPLWLFPPLRTQDSVSLLRPLPPDRTRSCPLLARPASRNGTRESANHGSNSAPEAVESSETILPPPAACGQSHAAFERRSIPAERSATLRSSLRFGRNTLGIPPSRALSAGCLAALGAHATLSTGC